MTEERRQLLFALRTNDVIRLNGRLRVIRNIKERQLKHRPARRYFTFDILRSSWTGSPHTTYSSSDLGNPGWRVELVARNYRPKPHANLP